MIIYRVILTEAYEPNRAITRFHTTPTGAIKDAEKQGYTLGERSLQWVELEECELLED